MRRINLKLLGVLALVIVLAVGVGYGVWYFNSGWQAVAMLNAAEKSQTEGELRASMESYLRYLALRPSDQETTERVALLSADIAELEDATFSEKRRGFRRLTRLLRSHPERNDLRKRLVNVLITQNAFSDVKTQIKELTKRNVVDPELDFLYANSCGALGQYDAAIKEVSSLIGYNQATERYETRLARAPEMVKAYLLFASAHRERGQEGRKDEEAADIAIEQMVKMNPKSAQGFLIRGNYLRETNLVGSLTKRRARRDLAKESLQKALELDGKDVDVLIANAMLARDEQRYALALEYLERAQQLTPEDETIYTIQAAISRQNGDAEDGVVYLKKGLETLSNSPTLVMELFAAHLAADQADQARKLIETMSDSDIALEYIDLIEAKMLMFEQSWSLALARLSDLRPRMLAVSGESVGEIDVLMARCYEVLGQWDRQLATSRRLLNTFPRSPAGQRGLAQSLMSMGQYANALDQLRRLRRQLGNEAFFQDSSLRDTYMQLLFELSKESPRYQEELRRLQKGIYDSENFEEIDKVIVGVRSLVAVGKLPEALERLDVGLIEYPDNEQLQDIYLTLIVKEIGPSKALEFLDEVTSREENPWKDRSDFLALRMHWTATKNEPDSVAELKAFEKYIPNYDSKTHVFLWLGLAKAHFSLGKALRQVDHCLRQARKLNPTDREIAELLFETALVKESEKVILEALEYTKDSFGKRSDLWNFQQARYLVWANSQESENMDWLQGVDRLVEKVEDIRPRWYRLLQLKGQIAELKGEKNVAIDHYKRSLDFGPMDLRVVTKLTQLLIGENRISETEEIIGRLDVVPTSMIQTQVLLHALSGEHDKALKIIDSIRWDNVTNVGNWIWRGRLLAYMGRDGAAEKALRRAVKIDSNDINAARALIDFLWERHPLSAYKEFQSVESVLTESPETHKLLAETCYRSAAVSAPLVKEQYLLKAVASNPEDVGIQGKYIVFCIENKRPDVATEHLNNILKEQLTREQKNEKIVTWARQSLARILSSQPNHRSFQQALGLIEATRVGGQLSPYNKRLKGFLLAQRDEPLYRQHGLRILEAIPNHQLKRREGIAVAELYFISNRWSECKEIMERQIVKNSDDIDLISRYCEMLFDRGEKNQGRKWLRKLKQIAPESLPVLRMLAVEAKIQGPVALRKFEKAMRGSLSKDGQKATAAQRIRIAKVFEAGDLLAAAEEQYRKAAVQDQKNHLELASFLAKQGKTEEAIQLCRQIVTKKNVRQICKLVFNAFSSHPETMNSTNAVQLKEWIELAKAESDDWMMQLQEAVLLDLEGKTAEAVERLNEMESAEISSYGLGMLANNRAYFNIKLGKNNDQVESDLKIAFENLGPKIELLDTRAMALMEKKQFDGAVNNLLQATFFQPSSGRYHFHLALAHQGLDDRVAATKALELAKTIGLSRKSLDPYEQSRYESLQMWLEN